MTTINLHDEIAETAASGLKAAAVFLGHLAAYGMMLAAIVFTAVAMGW